MTANAETVGVVLGLVRHGEYAQPAGVPSAHLPHPLTERGREQARAAAHTLAEFAASRGLMIAGTIDCSRMLRAWQTAGIIAEELGQLIGKPIRIEQFEALAERSLGAVANLTTDVIEELIQADPRNPAPPVGWKRDPDYCVPFQGAESLIDAGRRVAAHLLRRAAEGPPGIRICVGHGGAFRHAACLLGVLGKGDLPNLSMHHCEPVYLARRNRGGFYQVAGAWKPRGAVVLPPAQLATPVPADGGTR